MNTSKRKVLIAYRSRNRYVYQISREIDKILNQEGFEVQLLDVRNTRTKKWPSMDEFDGILVGTWAHHFTYRRKNSVYKIKDFPNKTKRFFRINEIELNNKERILGLFVSDPFLLGYIKDPIGADDNLKQMMIQKLPVKADIYKVIGPVVDLSFSSELNHDNRKYLRNEVKKLSRGTGLEFHYKGLNDFRDSDEIHDFTIRFAKLVKGEVIEKEKTSTYCLLCGSKIENPEAKFCKSCGGKIED
ncbi:MAG: hypothetical protein ACTSPS_03295 [Promethearchaeota archaeon]